jgi:hypothetical protein
MMQPGDYLAYYKDDSPRRWYVRVIKIYQPFNSKFWDVIVNSEEELQKTGYGFFEFGLGSTYHLALRSLSPDESRPVLSMYPKQKPFDPADEEVSRTPKRGSKDWGTIAELQAKGIL